MIDTDLYEAKRLYPFQEETVKQVLDEFRTNEHPFNLLYQLPTGGGKTVIFSAIAKQYLQEWGKRVLILTHRTFCSNLSSIISHRCQEQDHKF
jgi:superfamily II DNA or RNA helicase